MRTIAHISDLHFGRHSGIVAEHVLTSLRATNPDLIVVTGDLTQRARRAEFIQARHFLDRIVQPKLVVPGNHDMPLFNLFRRFMAPFSRYRQYISSVGAVGDFFRDEEIAVLGLNTARRLKQKSGRISIEQIALMRRTFSDLPRGVFRALATHHPLGFPRDAKPRKVAGRSSLALEAIAEVGVHLLMSGHHHRALSGEQEISFGANGSVLILHAGTAISTRFRGNEGNSYNLIRVSWPQLSISVMTQTADGGFHENCILPFLFHEGRWQTA
jgi:3',5'-cyclic AMP phosphodiesterase CpdA